ncbi:GH36-type glycosyl hydrolase domain-containing protein [Sphingorhabdus sp.]|uniref:GH36-type glycosyl hydrolase domain-containing protein n=1 Tax=Sphingorhabdus sp. TaxID=1902408 RepID=UPI0035AFB40D
MATQAVHEDSPLGRVASEFDQFYDGVQPPADPLAVWVGLGAAIKWLNSARAACADAPPEASKAAEWVLDNDYQIHRALKQVERDIPSEFYARLPLVRNMQTGTCPRVFALANEYLRATHLQLTLPTTVQFIEAYQRHSSLTIAELWAFPAMLRLACIEQLVIALTPMLHDAVDLPFEPSNCGQQPFTLDATERVARSISNLTLIASISWEDFFDQTSLVEAILSDDPSSHYRQMDFATRDRYRHAVEEVAADSATSELGIARDALKLAGSANQGSRDHHIGYWLSGDGRRRLEQIVGAKPAIGKRLGRGLLNRIGLIYPVAIGAIWLAALFPPIFYLWAMREGPLAWLGTLLVSVVPASIIALTLVQWCITLILPPRVLPKLDFSGGLPPDCRTIIVVPVILAKETEAAPLIQQLETHWLGNTDPAIQIALLADFKDSPAATDPGDDKIVQALSDGVHLLNERYGTDGVGPFHVLLRPRKYNPGEQCWMAWERKRGKLEEFNNLLAQDDDSGFSHHFGYRPALSGHRFVVTVDADTILPTGSVAKLVGTLAHPLNQAELDPTTGRIKSGYSIVQPRVETSPSYGEQTWFSRLFTGDTAIDIYSRAVSNVYQDMFGSAIFVGKGIYDLEAFRRSTQDRVPENAILSHDLFEGALGRVALASDIVLYEGFPGSYLEYAKRWHRWVRGDWQLLPWLGRSVRGSDGQRCDNPLSALDRWKIIDNLRRSLIAPSLLLLAVAGWTLLPGSPIFWTALVLFAQAGPIFTDMASGLATGRRRGSIRGLLRRLANQSGRWALAVVYLPYEASVAIHAVCLTVWRLVVTKKYLLQWTSAAQTAAKLQDKRARTQIWRLMIVGPAIAMAATALVLLVKPAAIWAALPLLLIWLFAPEIAYQTGLSRQRETAALDSDERAFLRRLARQTWFYFETFVGPEDNWLPPDNFQGAPFEEIAHRTSPTNIGMYLLSATTAWDMGYIGKSELALRFDDTLMSLDRLERHRGHILNWYDTQSLEPLEPRYVSVVDSGNLAGCLISCAATLRESLQSPELEEQRWNGLLDGVALLELAVAKLPQEHALLHRQIVLLETAFTDVRAQPWRWHSVLDDVCSRMMPEIEATMTDVAALLPTGTVGLLREAHIWTGRIGHQARSMVRDLDTFAPWHGLADPPPASLATHRRIVSTLASRSDAEALATARQLVEDSFPAEDGTADWRSEMLAALAAGQAALLTLDHQMVRLADRATTMAHAMDFEPLYDRERRLFHIGYNVSSDRLDMHHYDLLATEARLASFLAIANGDVPIEHWFHLGRPVTRGRSGQSLVSWNGSMFEYLMPRLLLRSGPETLLSVSERVAVEIQRDYGRDNKVPWGISESAFAARDNEHRYQYQAFGVPGLGLRRGLVKDLVVAPYASALALHIEPRAAVGNLRLLQELGGSAYGLCEAIDFTQARRGSNPFAIVNAYMAHHQGMILCAIGNALCNDILVERFERDPRMRVVSLLLNERVPIELPSEIERIEEFGMDSRSFAGPPPIEPWVPAPGTAASQLHLMGNGSLSSWVAGSGCGGLRWRQNALTRFIPDPTQRDQGTWIYVRDEHSGAIWSATRNPTISRPDEEDILFHAHMAEFRRRDHDIRLKLEVSVAVGDDVEIRRLTLVNESGRQRVLRLTSYGEVVLSPPLNDERHPAFNKLFVQSEHLPGLGGVLFSRRARNPDESPPVLLHYIVDPGTPAGKIRFESDRRKFIGRGRDLQNPNGAQRSLSNSVGWTLDPVMSLQLLCELAPYERIEISFVTVAAATRETVLDVAERYATPTALDWAINGAVSEAGRVVARLGIRADQMAELQALGSLVLHPHIALRAPRDIVKSNRAGQPQLWGMGLSGDHPILLIRVTNAGPSLFDTVVRAHQLWRGHGLETDLVILQSAGSGYIEPLRDDLVALLHELGGHWMLGRRGGVHLLFSDQIGRDQICVLEAVAAVVLDDSRGSLSDQLAEALRPARRAPTFASLSATDALDSQPVLVRPDDLLFDNETGGFTPDGQEYVIHLEPGQTTPAPWSNILSNEAFGTLVTEAGGGFTWAINSGENRLTPWTNDPVTDPPGEALYLRDEESAEVWTTTPGPSGGEATCQIRHGAGYSVWHQNSHGLEQELRVFVPVDDPVKLVRLRLKNSTSRHRRITATYYAQWLLGALRSVGHQTMVVEYDQGCRAILARNPWNPEFGDRTAFLVSSEPAHEIVIDRQEFLGEEGGVRFPAALGRWGRGGIAPAGTDPCGAYQVHLDLGPGEAKDILFVLGQGTDEAAAKSLATRWAQVDYAEQAFTKMRAHWDTILGAVEVQTPDPAFNIIINRWLIYQSLSSRILARAGFYQASGAYGFRDQLQDVLALLHVQPARGRAHILECCQHQFEEGDVLHWWHPPGGRGVRTRCSDDLLWLPYAVANYVDATGDLTILDEQLPFLTAPELGADEEDRYAQFAQTTARFSVLEHCNRALRRGLTRGRQGLPLIGTGDWNDGMDRVGRAGRGESIWLAWFAIVTTSCFAGVNHRLGDDAGAKFWLDCAEDLRQKVEEAGWDGGWYRRAYDDDGHPLGSAANEECCIDSISQSWSVFAGAPTDHVDQALRSAYRVLVSETEGLARLLWPPFDKTSRDPGYISSYPPGIRENGGQYSHATAWLGIAFSKAGDSAKAYEMFNMLNPINRSGNAVAAEHYRVEPYVVAADIASGEPFGGRGGWSWYTGAAGWTWRLGVEEILGLKVRDGYLQLEPNIPPDWAGYGAVLRRADGAISVRYEACDEPGTRQLELEVDGVRSVGTRVAFPTDGSERQVVARMVQPA